MPQIVDYAPAWLSRPSPGASFFSVAGADRTNSPAKHSRNLSDGNTRNETPYEGPLRILARRGNEVFVVVDNQIRWAKLTSLKDEWHQEVRKNRRDASRGREAEKNEDKSRSPSPDKGKGKAGDETTEAERGPQYRVG